MTAATARRWAENRPLDAINTSLAHQLAATADTLADSSDADLHDLSDLHYLGCFLCRRLKEDICEQVSAGEQNCPLHFAGRALQAA